MLNSKLLNGIHCDSSHIFYRSVDRKSCNELRAYLANIAEQCSAAASGEEAALPSVVVLDNLQHASGLGDAFAGLLPPDNRNMPVIIGTLTAI